jgi:hypothetical protein
MKASIAMTAVVAALGAPAAAQGATLTAQGSCFASTAAVPVTGAGFTPGSTVNIKGDSIFESVTADAAGNLAAAVNVPLVRGSTPKTLTITAEEVQNPANKATLSFPVVAEPFVVDASLNGNPRSTVRWRFAGFKTGEPIYGHFRFGGRTIRNYRFGVAKGVCGTLSVRARRLPVARLRYGKWTLKFDQSRSYSTKVPGRGGSLTIFRSFG